MKKIWIDTIAASILCILVGIFFFRLFYPESSLIVTPDYGRSDAWHFSFPTKYALSQSLHTLSLPLWRNDIGSGFPLFSEGQTGALFIPNLILFYIFPPVIAYNIALALAIASLGVGIYAFFRILGISVLAGMIASISVMFSGLSITQLPHITLLQGMSMLPIVAILSIRITTHTNIRTLALLSLALSQQLYAGFPQATFLTLFFSGLIVLIYAISHTQYRVMYMWATGVLLGIGAGATQILPSMEFLKAGTDPNGFDPTTATAYSMPFAHLLSYIDPFHFGNPAQGTYPPFYEFDGSIFWENTAYIGLLPILLLLGSIRRIKKHTSLFFWWGLLIMTIILASGKYGPAYILYSMWPLSLFRVPSRFLWLSLIAISYIASYVVTALEKKTAWRTTIHLLIFLLLIGHTVELMSTWWSYNLILPSIDWLSTPKTVPYVQNGKILTIGETKRYNETMTKTGWTKPDAFYTLRMGLSPDSNILWNVSQHGVYAGRFLKRSTITDTLISESIDTNTNIATMSSTKLLDIFAINTVISFTEVDAKDMKLDHTEKEDDITAFVYKNPTALPRAYLVSQATSAATLTQAVSRLNHTDFIPGQSVLLEEHAIRQNAQFTPFLKPNLTNNTQSQSVTWKTNTHEHIQLDVHSDTDSILVLADTYYPGWVARVDTSIVPILAANLSQRAIFIPKGTHTVTFTYTPMSVKQGNIVSAISLIIIVFLMILPRISAISRTQKTAHEPASRRRNIRRTS